MSKFQIPKKSFSNLKKPNKLLIISFLTIIVANCISIFGFSFLDLKIKIILSLSIISLVLAIDVIVLYTEYYKYYYQTEYLNKVYHLIDINTDNIEKSIAKLKEESTEIKKSVQDNNNAIEFIKSKIS